MRPLPTIVLLSFFFIASAARADSESIPNGYAQPLKGGAIADLTKRYQAELRGLGVPVVVQSCRLAEQVAVGVRNSETATGAACQMSIGDKPPKELVVCDSDLSGFGALFSGEFVDSSEWMAAFIRKNCF